MSSSLWDGPSCEWNGQGWGIAKAQSGFRGDAASGDRLRLEGWSWTTLLPDAVGAASRCIMVNIQDHFDKRQVLPDRP